MNKLAFSAKTQLQLKTAGNIGLLPWLCGATRRFKISYAATPGTFPKFDVRHGSKPCSLCATLSNNPNDETNFAFMPLTNSQRFFLKYVSPIVALILTAIVAGQIYMTTLSEADLIPVTGRVIFVYQDKYKHYKYTDDRITILLDTQKEPFYFFDNRETFFATIMSSLHFGDTITLLHRTNIQSRIATGSEYKIMKIQKGTNVLYPFDKAKETFSDVGGVTIVGAIAFWFAFFFYRNNFKKKGGT